MSNINLAVRIQGVPERRSWQAYLEEMLIAGGPRQYNTKGKLNPKWDTEIIVDQNHELWSGAKATLESFNSQHTHMLVIQDDVLPCRDLISTALEMIKLLPDEPISLFSNKDVILMARDLGRSWAKLKVWFMAQAYIMPIPTIKDFLEFEKAHINPKIYFDDDRWAHYFFYHNRYVFASAPSLVEHLGWNTSTLSGYKPGYTYEPRLRMAKWFLGFENSGLDIDWSSGLTDPVPDNDGNWSQFCHNFIP